MKYSLEDAMLIKNPSLSKGYDARRLFPENLVNVQNTVTVLHLT